MKTKKKLPVFTISRRRWLRGEGGSASCLQRPYDRKRCCLGAVAVQLGYKVKDILSETSPAVLECSTQPFIDIGLIDQNGGNSLLCHSLMSVNDDSAISDAQREEKLRELAKGHFRLRFVP